MIQLKNAALESSAGKKSVHALRCLNVTLPETGLVVLTGASGSGKTALLHLLALRETPSRGEILIGGENTARWSEARRSAWLRECAAADEALLFADLTLSENAERAAVLAGFSGRDARENAREALALLGLEGAAGVYPDRLSGEQRRLGALACALARKGRVLLLDEPVSGLDPKVTAEMYALIEKLNREDGITVIMISHDIAAAVKYASHILHIGDAVFFGTRAEYLQSPQGRLFAAEKGGDRQ